MLIMKIIKLMFDCFRNSASNAHQCCCADSPIKSGLIFSQFDDLDHSESQVRLKLDKKIYLYYNSNISDNIYMAFTLGITVMMLVSTMALTLMQGHSG